MLYGGAAVLSVVLCLYLLLCKGNAIAPGTTPPVHLRRWAAAIFGVSAVGHLWWYCLFVLSGGNNSWAYVVCVVLDCVLMLTTIFGTMLSMLQDRRRPLWPFVAALTPIAVLGGLQIARPDTDFLTPALVYTLAVYVFFTIYMTVAIRQYGRWLHDLSNMFACQSTNYADLEHKEVRQSYTLLILFLLLLAIYEFTSDGPSLFLLRIADFILFGLLLWRVETQPSLSLSSLTPGPSPKERGVNTSAAENIDDKTDDSPLQANNSPLLGRGAGGEAVGGEAFSSRIGQLLEEHCVATKLYLQNDLTLAQLSAAVGLNRSYISQYFSAQGMNYNSYINGLRIQHFISLYQEASAAHRPFTVQQLAYDSGYRSYSTFSLAFKQRMGQSVTAWTRSTAAS